MCAPRKGSTGAYLSMHGNTVGFTVLEVEGNLCWAEYDNGSKGPFIWRFRDGLNNLHDWPGKSGDVVPQPQEVRS